MNRLWRVAEFLALTAVLAFATLLLALRFWILPHVERWHDDIEAILSSAVGQQVRIGAIDAGWAGLRPRLHLADVRLYDQRGREALVLPSVENVLSWRSLAFRDLRLHLLEIDGPKLLVRRDASGTLHVAGIRLASGAGDGGGVADWILGQTDIVVRGAEVTWVDEQRGAPPLTLSSLDFRLRNRGDEHDFGLSGRPPPELGASLELRAALAGRSVGRPAAWNGRLYASLGSTDLAGWRPWLDYPVDVRRGHGALRLWATLDSGRVRRVTADLALADVVARLAPELPLLELDSLQGRLQARRLGTAGYELVGRRVALAPVGGPPLAPGDFRFSWEPGRGDVPERGSLAASRLELEPLARLAAALPLPAEWRERLSQIAPRGRVSDVSLEWHRTGGEAPLVAGRARFSDLGMQAFGGIPAFSGLTGRIRTSGVKGSLYLGSRQAAVELPQVFPDPRLAFDSLDGEVDWKLRREGQVDLHVASLSFANADLAGNVFGSYTWTGAGPGRIDLSALLTRADGRRTARYLPLGTIVGPQTRTWLSRAILAGNATDVRLRLQGDLRDFPFVDPARGQFTVAAHVSGGSLAYDPKWPRIDDIDADLLFDRDRMEIVGRHASILGAAVTAARASIASMKSAAHVLSVEGEVEGPTSAFLSFVEHSPVLAMTDGMTAGMHAAGRARLQLKLALPIEDSAKTKVAGTLRFDDNRVDLYPRFPPLQALSGAVSFTESGLALHGVHGRLFGGPVALEGGTRHGELAVTASGQLTAAGAAPLLAEPWPRYLSGGAPYTASVRVSRGRPQLEFETPLRGVASALPPPFAKAARAELPLRVALIPSPDGKRDRISLALGDIARAEILRRRAGDSMAIERTSVWLSPIAGEAIRLPERPGTLVYGSLGSLGLDRWLPLLLEGGSGKAMAAQASFDLSLGTLDAFGKRAHAVDVRGSVDDGGWSASVKAEELAGTLAYRNEKSGLLIARLSRLRIPDDAPGVQPERSGGDLPSVDLVAERFSFHGKQLGRIEVAATRVGPDWRIDKLSMTDPDASMIGHGLWRPDGERALTSLELKLDVRDAGAFLGRIGYPGTVKRGKASMQATLSWAGEPLAIDYPSLSGKIQFQASDGQFLEIDPGFGKLLSLMSLQELPRRITLDFRDVFSKGFQFDRIAANAPVDHGVMRLQEFSMRGSSASVEASGEVNLVEETQDVKLRIMPSLGATASTVVGILNPLAGVASLIAQHALKDPLGQIFSYEYAVSGSWAAPKVKELTPLSAPAAHGEATK